MAIRTYRVKVSESTEFTLEESPLDEDANDAEVDYVDGAVRNIGESLVYEYQETLRTLHKLHREIQQQTGALSH